MDDRHHIHTGENNVLYCAKLVVLFDRRDNSDVVIMLW